MQFVCEGSGEAVPTKVVKVMKPACEVIEAKRKNAALSNLNTDIETKLLEPRTASSTMGELLAGAQRQITSSKTKLADAQLALDKLTGETAG